MYKNMPSVLLGGFLGGSDGRTPLGQPDPETRTGRTTPKILTRKPGSDGQQPPRAGPTLSETKSKHCQELCFNFKLCAQHFSKDCNKLIFIIRYDCVR